MNKYIVFKFVFLLIFSLFGNAAFAEKKEISGELDDFLGDIATIIEEALIDVVDSTVDKAKKVVRENTGIDLTRRGYARGRDHEPLPKCASDEARRELNQFQDEYNREIRKLEEELDRKLAKAEAEFKREAAKENKAKKVYEKREMLEKKVDDAYAKFDNKVAKQNRKFDDKRDRVINKEHGSDQCDEGRNNRGKKRDDREKDKGERGEREDRDERDRGVPNHTRERADESNASDVAREQSAAHSETEEKKWWKFWK